MGEPTIRRAPCVACDAIDACEPPPAPCTCPDDRVDLLDVSADALDRAGPQIGEPSRVSWEAFAVRLMRPHVADVKNAAGGWSLARYRGNHRCKAALEAVHALVVDVDEAGDVARVAEALARYRGIVHETFTSTPGAPRCRFALMLAAPVDASTYERVHAVVRRHLSARCIVADAGAKDATRLSYWPVRRPGTGYALRVLDGAPLDASAVLAAHPERPRPVAPVPTSPVRADRYARAALLRAADALDSTAVGDRHAALSREAFALARLELRASDIEAALLPAFVRAAGDARRREGERTIRDAIRARRGAA